MSQDIEDTYGAPPKAVNRVAGRCRDVEGQAGHHRRHRNRYQVDPALAGCKVELVFDPFDLSFLRARHEGRDAGTAQPFQVSRLEHAHRGELAVHRRGRHLGRHGRQHRDLAGPARRGKLQPGDELADVFQPGLAPV